MPKLKLYHGTTCDNARLIQREGLRKQTQHLYEAKWYTVATDRGSAIDHGAGCVVTFILDLPKPPPRKWLGYPLLWPAFKHTWRDRPSSWFALREDIPAGAVTAVTKVKPQAKRHGSDR